MTQVNVSEMKKSDDPVIRRLLGVQRGYGQFIGLDDAWAARVIEAVGNYGEMFERDLSSGSVKKLARGPNKPWTQGGIMYALPIRYSSRPVLVALLGGGYYSPEKKSIWAISDPLIKC